MAATAYSSIILLKDIVCVFPIPILPSNHWCNLFPNNDIFSKWQQIKENSSILHPPVPRLIFNWFELVIIMSYISQWLKIMITNVYGSQIHYLAMHQSWVHFLNECMTIPERILTQSPHGIQHAHIWDWEVLHWQFTVFNSLINNTK